jgi:hypothetical protein
MKAASIGASARQGVTNAWAVIAPLENEDFLINPSPDA